MILKEVVETHMTEALKNNFGLLPIGFQGETSEVEKYRTLALESLTAIQHKLQHDIYKALQENDFKLLTFSNAELGKVYWLKAFFGAIK